MEQNTARTFCIDILILIGALAMMAAMAFTEHDLAFAVNLLPTDRKRRFIDKCLAVAARCGLSERETEIMTLFAKGRNLAYIQEELCLSKSTVSTHRQHIYQKLGVHSSQEMIDLIQEEKAEQGGNDERPGRFGDVALTVRISCRLGAMAPRTSKEVFDRSPENGYSSLRDFKTHRARASSI